MFGSEVTKHSTTIEALHLHIKRRYYYITLLSFFSLVTLYVIAFSGTSKNADVVNGYLVGLDMGAGNWRLSHWYLPGDNFWLQDALAYAIATRVFGNHPFLMIILPAFAWAAIVVVAWTLSQRGRDMKDVTWSILVIAPLLAFPILRDNPLMAFITVANDHIVTILQSLLLLLLADRFLSRGGFLSFGLFLALGTAAIAGDPLALFIVGIPVAGGALLTNQAPLHRRLLVAAGAVFIIAAGYTLVSINAATGGFTIIESVATGFNFAALADLPRNLTFTLQGVLGFWGADFFGLPVRRALPQLARVPMLLLAGWTLVLAIQRISTAGLQLRPVALDFLDSALTLGVGLVLAACLFSTVMIEFWSARYVLPAFVYAAILVARQAPQFKARATVGMLALGGSLLAANAYAVNPHVRVKSNTPELAHWLENHGLGFGYAQYWTAAPITLLSRDKVKVLPIIDDHERVVPYLLNIRGDWYPSPLNSRRPFFVIVDPAGEQGAFKSDASEAVFGPPTERSAVAGFTVDIYR